MPSPLRSSDRKMNALSGSNKFEEYESSDARRRKRKRENGVEERPGKPSEPCGTVEPDLGRVYTKRKTMNARAYTSSLKLPLKNDKTPGCSGVLTGSDSQVLLSRPINNGSDGGSRSHGYHRSPLKPNILKHCQVLQLPEHPPKSSMKEKEPLSRIKRVERRLEQRMRKLVKKQKKEIDEFHRIWDEHKIQLLEQHRQRTALVIPRHSNSQERLSEHKRLDDELKKRLEEVKKKREIDLNALKRRHLAKKTKKFEKKVSRLKKLKSQEVEPSCTRPSDESDPDHPIENPTVSPSQEHGSTDSLAFDRPPSDGSGQHHNKQLEPSSAMPADETAPDYPIETPSLCPSHEPGSADSLAFGTPPVDDYGQHYDKHRSVNASENNITTELPSSEGQLSGRPASTVREVIECGRIDLVGGEHASADDSDTNVIAKLSADEEQLPSEPLSSVEKVKKSACVEIGGGLNGSDNASQINIVMNLPSSEIQLSVGASPRIEEEMTSACIELGHENPPSPTCVQMTSTDSPAQKEYEQLPAEVTKSDQTVHESPDIPADTNQPASPLPSLSPGGDHVLVNPPNNQQVQPSVDTNVDTNQPTSPSPGSDHRLILPNPVEHQHLPQSVSVPVDMDQPSSISSSVLEQIPCREEQFISINTTSAQQSQCPPFPTYRNQCDPVPASIVVPSSHRERQITTLNAESLTQYENSQHSSTQAPLGPTYSAIPVREVPPRTNLLVDGTPVLPDQVNPHILQGTTPSISGSMGDLRSHIMFQGMRQEAPQMTAQRLTMNPLYNEYQKICKESEGMVESHEKMKLMLKSDYEKELAEIRKKYDLKLQDAEANFLVKKKELDINSAKVWMHGLFAQSFLDMIEYKPPARSPQDASSNLTQQVHLPHSQPQPIFSPSHLTNAVPVLSACNRQNRPQLHTTVTPPRPNFQNKAVHAPSLQYFRPQPLFPATRPALALTRAPQHPRPLSAFRPTRVSEGPQSAIRCGYPNIENPSSSLAAYFPYLQNQVARQPSSLLPSDPTYVSNLGFYNQFSAVNNGVNQGTNIGHSRERTSGLICLSDDE